MTHEEALLYFPIMNGAEIDDLYENRVFELQQFFLKQVPLSRLYRAKIKRMRLEHQAYLELGGICESNPMDLPDLITTLSPYLLEVTRVYQTNLSQLKSTVIRVSTLIQLETVSTLFIANMENYARAFHYSEKSSVVRVTQPEDELKLLQELILLDQEERITFAQISNLNMNSHVRREANRLSLWLEMEADERTV